MVGDSLYFQTLSFTLDGDSVPLGSALAAPLITGSLGKRGAVRGGLDTVIIAS